jgi:hypothetical protein
MRQSICFSNHLDASGNAGCYIAGGITRETKASFILLNGRGYILPGRKV